MTILGTLLFINECYLQGCYGASLPRLRLGIGTERFSNRSVLPAVFSFSTLHSIKTSPRFPTVLCSRAANASISRRRAGRIRRLSGAFHSPILATQPASICQESPTPRVRQSGQQKTSETSSAPA